MRYQFYWKNWWKLWPTYRSTHDFYHHYSIIRKHFTFGPLQIQTVEILA
jgi:hypothetical protein